VAAASELEQLVESIENFDSWGHGEKLKFFGWYIHSQKGQDRFDPAALRGCYEEVGIEKPSNVNPYIATLEKKKPKEVLRDGRGLYLPKHVRDDFEERYGQRESTVQVTKLLADLPQQVPDLAQRTFLDEALTCFQHGAFRAAMVMAWNLAYHHLCDFVLKKKLAEFNQRWPLNYAGHHKNAPKQIAKMEDFADELKESEVIAICASARIVTGDMQKVLNVGLQRRNTAAHPSSATITPLQAEAHIEDLVLNFVLKLK
jgi:hypothetical protein